MCWAARQSRRPTLRLACAIVSDEPEFGYHAPDDLLARLVRALEAGMEQSKPAIPLPPVPTVPRYYQVTLLDVPGSGGEFSAIFVPHTPDYTAAAVLEDPYLRYPPYLTELQTGMSIDPPLLVSAILATRPDHSRWYGGGIKDVSDDPVAREHAIGFPDALPGGLDRTFLANVERFVAQRDPLLHRFASRVALEPVIPVESSPLSGTSLAELVKSMGSTAVLGYLAMQTSPLLLITVPVGIIVMGGAQGIAEGLRQGLQFRIATWFGATPRPEPEANVPPSQD